MLRTLLIPSLSKFSFIFLAVFGLCINAYGQTKLTYNTYLTTKSEHEKPLTTPKKHFDCSDKVYSVIEVDSYSGPSPSTHNLMVNWYNPGGKLEQKTRYEFTSFAKGTRLWAWLKLSAPTGAAIGKIFDPAFGMGEFIGQWRAQIRIDDKKVAEHKFDVLC